jgi:putative membrane protein
MNKIRKSLALFLKGFAMGAADVVPGVSGGTIAFITGIYDELLGSISSINLDSIKLLFKEGPASFWKKINGAFLLILFVGIISSVVTLAKLIKYLLANEPILIWSFFFGLIIASVIYVAKQVKTWNLANIFSLLIGAVVAFLITVVSPSSGIESTWYIFISGMIAICAMILPGISGSFILLLLGSYSLILGSVTGLSDAVKTGNSADIISYGINIVTFGIGCIIGLALFSRVLTYVLSKKRDLTIAVLTGFMIGSLNKVWPWKETTKFRMNSHGEEVPWIENNILPSAFEKINQTDAQFGLACVMLVIGFVLVFGIEKLGNQVKN